MLTFYYSPLSVNARRVWIALLEKGLPFEPVGLSLDGDQFGEDFTAVNPLQRVPVLVDEGLRIVESLAILDYLEAKYPTPPLLPDRPAALAQVRMVQMVAVTDLQPATLLLTRPLVGLETDPDKLESARQRVLTVLRFWEDLLGENPYFGGNALTLADIVAGTLMPSLPLFGFTFDAYPRLKDWLAGLLARPSWQQSEAPPEAVQAALPHIREIVQRRS